jgi:hypothetical protein
MKIILAILSLFFSVLSVAKIPLEELTVPCVYLDKYKYTPIVSQDLSAVTHGHYWQGSAHNSMSGRSLYFYRFYLGLNAAYDRRFALPVRCVKN